MIRSRRAVVALAVVLLGLSLPIGVRAAAPVAMDDPVTIDEDAAPTTVDVLANDDDPETDPKSIVSATDPDHGEVVIAGDGLTLTYEPDADYAGADSFDYTMEAGGDEASATVTVNIDPVNDEPVADNDSLTVPEDAGATSVPVLVGDTDIDGDVLQIVAKTNGAKGTVTITGGGSGLTYAPAANANGADTFSYTISDGNETDTATVAVTITASNDDPTPIDDEVTVPEDAGAVAIDVLDNDTDIDGDTIEIAVRTHGAKGIVSITGGGSGLTYNPNTNAIGTDSFTYLVSDDHGGTGEATVWVTIDPSNDPPVADDESVTLLEDALATAIPVLVGDSDIDGDGLLVATTPVPNAPKGTVVVTGGGTGLTYRPDPDANGTDAFTYRVLDGAGGMDIGTVSVTITPVNDPPLADDESVTLPEDAPATAIPVLVGDTDIDDDGLLVASVSDASKGTVVITGGGTGLTYQPDANVNGTDSFAYRVSDGAGGTDLATVSVIITPVNDAPTADDETLTVAEGAAPTTVLVLPGDKDIEGDQMTIVAKTNGTKGSVAIAPGGGSVTYKPYAGFSGPDSFTYTISDGHGGTDIGTVAVTITGINDAPSAVNDGSMSVPEGAGAVALPVLANDSDRDGDTLRITAVTNGTLGTVRITGGGSGLTYDPAPMKHGVDTFSYTVSDGRGGTDSAVVLVTVKPDVAPPAITGLTQSVLSGALGSRVRIRIGWTALDPGSGIKSFQLQRSLDGKAYETIGPPGASARTYDWNLTPGSLYRFRIRATDRENNTSTYVAWPDLTPSLHQETSSLATWTGTWTTSSNARMSGGGGRHTFSSNRRFTFVFTGRDVAWVATKTSTSGRAQVFIDGQYQRTIDLDAAATTYRQIVFSKHYASRVAHTMEIRPLGDGRVDVDAIVVLR